MEKRVIPVLVATLLCLALLAGCASIVSGTTQDISVSSQPSGARISVLDAHGLEVASGQTPVTLSLERGDGFFRAGRYKVIVEKAGFAKREFQVKGDLNAGWYLLGNFLLGGPIGWIIVDPLTGAMWNLSPRSLSSALEVAGIGNEGSLHVALAQDLSAELMALATPVGTAD